MKVPCTYCEEPGVHDGETCVHCQGTNESEAVTLTLTGEESERVEQALEHYRSEGWTGPETPGELEGISATVIDKLQTEWRKVIPGIDIRASRR